MLIHTPRSAAGRISEWKKESRREAEKRGRKEEERVGYRES